MKKLVLGLLGVGVVACQQAAPTRQATAQAARPAAAPPPSGLPLLFSAADTLTPTMRAVLRQNDLSGLWHHPGNTVYNYPLNVMEGFFGPEHYHFALLLTQVTRDAADPAIYHVAGKTRYFPSHSVRPFTGTLTVRRLANLSYPGFLRSKASGSLSGVQPADTLAARLYTAHARLQLREAATANSGIFEGEALLDFYTAPGQQPDYVYVFAFEGFDDRLPTRGGEVLLRGNRRNSSTGQTKPFIVSLQVAAVAPFVFKDFWIDERMGQIKPKYRHLGWNELWQNDEWWADAPKPKTLL